MGFFRVIEVVIGGGGRGRSVYFDYFLFNWKYEGFV